jgi:hypothetical protein
VSAGKILIFNLNGVGLRLSPSQRRNVAGYTEQRSFSVKNFHILAVALPAIAIIFFSAGAPAYASTLTINGTFDSSITSLPNAGAIEGAINLAISTIEGDIASPRNITVAIDFQNMNSGLGESTTSPVTVSYFRYYNALKAIATSPDQLTALASLGVAPVNNASLNPVNGTNLITLTTAEARNLGFSGDQGTLLGSFDTVIALNTAITSPPNGLDGNYSLESVAMHELDESLGIGGTGSNLGKLGGVGDLDLYRYSAPGVRSYTTDPSAVSYFSIDGGNTVLSYFDQVGGADYADWASDPVPPGFPVQVQNAFGQPGADPTLGPNELIAFESIGYSEITTAPEPSTLLLCGSVLAVIAGVRKRRLSAK